MWFKRLRFNILKSLLEISVLKNIKKRLQNALEKSEIVIKIIIILLYNKKDGTLFQIQGVCIWMTKIHTRILSCIKSTSYVKIT